MKVKNNSYVNDLEFINEVLSCINTLVSYTYGPSAGIVGFTTPDTVSFESTKDGRTVVNKLVFSGDTDNRVLNIMKDLVRVIKLNSGDGSTSAVKLVSYLIKNALDVMYLDNTEEYKKGFNIFRNNIPKVIDKVVSDIIKILDIYKKKPTNFEDLLNIAKISLNNDEALIHPFRVLFNTLHKNNVTCNANNYFDIESTSDDEYGVYGKQGYTMPVKHFEYTAQKDFDIKEAYFMMTKSRINYEDLHYWSYFIEISSVFKHPIVVLISSIEEEAKTALTELYREFEARKIPIKLSIMVSPANFSSTTETFEDVGYLLNSSVINFEREYITTDTGYGEKSNPFFIKTGDPILDTDDKQKHKRAMVVLEKLYESLSSSRRCDFKKLGNNLVLTVSLKDSTEPNEPLRNHIENLREMAKEDTDQGMIAKSRLIKLDGSTYVIKVPEHITSDGYRRASAFMDATKAINSSLKDGFIMGGNVAPFEAIETLIRELTTDNDDIDCRELVTNLTKNESLYLKDLTPIYKIVLSIMKNSYGELIQDIIGDKEYKDVVNYSNQTICDEIVIEPYMTDYTILRHSLATFSTLVASRLLILIDPAEAGRMDSLSRVSTIDLNMSPRVNVSSNVNLNKSQEPAATTAPIVNTVNNILVPKDQIQNQENVAQTIQEPPQENIETVVQPLQPPIPEKSGMTEEERKEHIKKVFAVHPVGNVTITGNFNG